MVIRGQCFIKMPRNNKSFIIIISPTQRSHDDIVMLKINALDVQCVHARHVYF